MFWSVSSLALAPGRCTQTYSCIIFSKRRYNHKKVTFGPNCYGKLWVYGFSPLIHLRCFPYIVLYFLLSSFLPFQPFVYVLASKSENKYYYHYQINCSPANICHCDRSYNFWPFSPKKVHLQEDMSIPNDKSVSNHNTHTAKLLIRFTDIHSAVILIYRHIIRQTALA